MGGTARRGLLFEGPPGTGKTYVAKAMAAEAEVPFLFVSATAFQSMYYGATARKIRSYFKALRKTARREGGAIGFMEEIDAIAGVSIRPPSPPIPAGCGGLVGLPTAGGGPVTNASVVSEGTGGVVNELLVQMQSFDEPTGWQVFAGRVVDMVNLLLPAQRQLHRPRPRPANILLIAATNRASALDPALLRPGRFDRVLTFEPPGKQGRRDLIDLMLGKRAHDDELDRPDVRDHIAALTTGYTPARLENLFDEALVEALRRGSRTMQIRDVHAARLVADVGMGQPVAYTEHEARLIATHEAGHAVVAHIVAPQRRLEVLTIVKRKDALGMLAHNDTEDVFTRSRAELLGLIQIAFGGMVAEEVFFGDVSTGPSSDLNYATTVAAQMVGAAGMVGSLINLSAVQGSVMSDTNLVGRVIADAPSRAAVEQLLAEQKAVARSVIEEHRHVVEALRDALLERHELVGAEILDVLEQAGGRPSGRGHGRPAHCFAVRTLTGAHAAGSAASSSRTVTRSARRRPRPVSTSRFPERRASPSDSTPATTCSSPGSAGRIARSSPSARRSSSITRSVSCWLAVSCSEPARGSTPAASAADQRRG